MRIKGIIIMVSILFFAFKCDDGIKETTQSQDQQELEQIMKKIKFLASSYDCSDAEQWNYVAYGAKACGGPVGYIAYHQQINEEEFLNLIEKYTKAQDNYNTKWGVFSDCSVPPEPLHIVCVENKPQFIYE